MKIINKLPLVRISAVILLFAMIATAATFGGTYSWFVDSDSVSVTGTMGTVDISLNGTTIKNDSTIPIIVRVRVIAEWEKQGDTQGVPPGEIEITSDDTDWQLYKADGGTFLAYTSGTRLSLQDKTDTGYGIIEPSEDGNIISLPTITKPNDITGWTPTITFIAEALQATEKAYTYTTEENNDVPSWKIEGGA